MKELTLLGMALTLAACTNPRKIQHCQELIESAERNAHVQLADGIVQVYEDCKETVG